MLQKIVVFSKPKSNIAIYSVFLFLLCSNNIFAQYQIINTFAGGVFTGTSIGDGGPATAARLQSPSGICLDRYGNVYITDQNDCRVRMVDTAGIITTVAGCGPTGAYSGDFGPADSAKLNYPEGVAVDTFGRIYIADQSNNVIRMVKDGIIYTIAGTGFVGDTGDGGPATNAKLWKPADVGVDYMGNVYFVDQDNSKMKKIDTAGILTTIAGTGIPGYSGDGGPASAAQLNFPEGIGVDSCGNVYIADFYNSCVRRVDATTGIITTVAGTDSVGYFGDGGPATNAWFDDVSAIGLDHLGNIYITDYYNFCIRKVSPSGIISTIAGSDSLGFSGDCGMATNAKLSFPQGVAADDSGNVYIADYENFRVRKVYNGPLPSKIPSLTLPQINIFPNPSTGKFILHSNINLDAYTVIINNTMGEQVLELPHIGIGTGTKQQIDLSVLPDGIYFITLKSGDKVLRRKIVVVH